MMIVGTGKTLLIGAIAGAIGLGLGIVLGFIAGYVGGVPDTIITSIIDIYMTIPSFLILILVATMLKGVTLGVVDHGVNRRSRLLAGDGARHPRPGAVDARAPFRHDGQALGDEAHGNHHEGAGAQPAALPGDEPLPGCLRRDHGFARVWKPSASAPGVSRPWA